MKPLKISRAKPPHGLARVKAGASESGMWTATEKTLRKGEQELPWLTPNRAYKAQTGIRNRTARTDTYRRRRASDCFLATRRGIPGCEFIHFNKDARSARVFRNPPEPAASGYRVDPRLPCGVLTADNEMAGNRTGKISGTPRGRLRTMHWSVRFSLGSTNTYLEDFRQEFQIELACCTRRGPRLSQLARRLGKGNIRQRLFLLTSTHEAIPHRRDAASVLLRRTPD